VRLCDTLSPQLTHAFAEAGRQLGILGLTLTAWNAEGERLDDDSLDAQHLSGSRHDVVAGLVREIAEQRKPGTARSPWGEVFLGVAVYERRQIVAVAIASFASVETDEVLLADQETLREAFEGDEAMLREYLAQPRRYHAHEGAALIEILSSAIDREKAMGVAEGELAGLSNNLAATYEELDLVYRISGSMNLTQDLSTFIREEVCQELLELMTLDHVAVVIYPRRVDRAATMVVSCGEADIEPESLITFVQTHIRPDLQRGASYVINNSADSLGADGQLDVVKRYAAVPLPGEDGLAGVLVAINKGDDEFDSIDAKLLNSVGSHAAAFLNNHRLYSDLQSLLFGVLEALTESVDAKDPYTCGHSRRVAKISQRLAEMIGLDDEHVRQIYMAGLLHDVGKIGVSEAVLRKPGKLTADEYNEIKEHPAISARILGGIRQLDEVAVAILSHHERPDGKGYPNGVGGEDFPLAGRILALADTFDAMTSNRTYRDALSLDEVEAEIRRCRGTQFDPMVVDQFLSLDLASFLEELRKEDDK
jgi:putative nucleotidyltransferase with HDIG domain